MGDRTYWLDLFTADTWAEFRSAGGTVSGFSEHRWGTVQKVKPGDYMLCYLTGISRFIGLLEVVAEPFIDESRVWASAVFPSRVRVKTLVALTPETAVPVETLRDRLSMFDGPRPGSQWTGPFRGSPARWKESDAEVVIAALREAERSPVARPFDPRKLNRSSKRRPSLARAAEPADAQGVDEPLDDAYAEAVEPVGETPSREEVEEPVGTAKEERAHTEMQWLLGKLGNDLGLSVWFPMNDRGSTYNGHALSELRLGELPLMFGPKVLRTIRNIDVLWIGEGSVEAAFEIESTTSIYSGVLRLSDLIALVPGVSIPLFIVAPDERRRNVFREVTRPTFNRLQPAMSRICRYLSFSTLRTKVPEQDMLRYMNPQFIGALSEACLMEDE